MIPNNEKINSAGVRIKARGGRFLTGVKAGKRLPTRTEVMLARVHRDIEVGTAVGSANPGAVQAEAGSGSRSGEKLCVVLKEIDEGLPGPGLAKGCWDFSVFTSNLTSSLPHPGAAACSMGVVWARDTVAKLRRKIARTVFMFTAP